MNLFSRMESNETTDGYEQILLGYVIPTVAISTIVTNMFALIAFGKGACSPTTVLLMSIAIADMICCIAVSPHFIYIYAYSQRPIYKSPFMWCATYGISLIITTAFHTASMWLTVTFCIERYICICHPFRARQICTLKKTGVAVCFIYILALAMHTWILFFIEGGSFDMYRSACLLTYGFDGFLGILNMLFRFIFCQTIPCVLLAFLTMRLIYALRASRHFRREYFQDTTSADTTRISAAIAVLFLIAEVPFVVIFALDIYDLFTDYSIKRPYLKTVVIVSNTMLFVAYHLNFWIYCLMGSAFRRTIIRIIHCGTDRPVEKL